MKVFVSKNGIYNLEEICNIKKGMCGTINNSKPFLSLVYKNKMEDRITFSTIENRDDAFIEIANILKGE